MQYVRLTLDGSSAVEPAVKRHVLRHMIDVADVDARCVRECEIAALE